MPSFKWSYQLVKSFFVHGNPLIFYEKFSIDVVEPAGSDTYVVSKFSGSEITARFKAETKVKPGDKVSFSFDISKASYFDPISGNRLN
ncbi:MAG: hypothetical protein CBB89_05030 [Rhizobiales bacterium TMED29]|nr:MAG: hypothetical protein CBB89_05030 [Rhizobiales bacterium TMED29]